MTDRATFLGNLRLQLGCGLLDVASGLLAASQMAYRLGRWVAERGNAEPQRPYLHVVCDRCISGEGGSRVDVHTVGQRPCSHVSVAPNISVSPDHMSSTVWADDDDVDDLWPDSVWIMAELNAELGDDGTAS